MGTIEQRTSGRGRIYVHTDDNGVETKVPSVTTVLGALPKSLEYWGFKLGLQAAQHLSARYNGVLPESIEALYEAAKQTDYAPYRALRKAGNRGTDVHAVAESLIKTGKLEDLPAGTEAGSGYVDALVKWYDEREVAAWEVIGVEVRLFSVEHLYAGTADFLARKPDGKYVSLDFKSSKAVYESHTIQAAAYSAAAVEMGLFPPDAEIENHVVRLGEDGEYEVVLGRHTLEDFLAVKAVHEMLKSKDKKGVKL